MPTEAQKDAHAKYRKKAVKQVNVPFYPKDRQIYEFVSSQDNKAGYIKGLIERDMLESESLTNPALSDTPTQASNPQTQGTVTKHRGQFPVFPNSDEVIPA